MADQNPHDDTVPDVSPERPYSDFDYSRGAYRAGYTGERLRRRHEFPGEYQESPGRKYDHDFGYGNRYRREYMRGERDTTPQYGPGDEMPRREGRFNWRSEGPSGQRYPRGPHTGHGPAGYQRSEERIFEDVCDRLTAHGWVDASDVEVDVGNGVVTLRGQVSSRREKRLAEDSAASVRGVQDVQNRLTIRGIGSAPEGGQTDEG